ncbi:hypothetical protein [Streptomyces sp. 184]|uniref:hypothetical protein n=1 Tax=Streptomyces sp. 184 TaxID=1827526 RepID=UPI003892BF8B
MERQAVIVNNHIAFAWKRAMRDDCPPNDPEVWASLQAALFAAIVVQRILHPGKVRKYPQHQSQRKSQEFAQCRGERLRNLLGQAADASVLQLTKNVRDPFEHVDERLDQIMVSDPISLSDWYISTGKALVTPRLMTESSKPKGYGLRVFFPAGGVLYFGSDVLDLYELDVSMLELRAAIDAAREKVRTKISGRSMFGGSVVVDLLTAEGIQKRVESWLMEREGRGHDVGVRVGVQSETGE